jgi:hypothetical protein
VLMAATRRRPVRILRQGRRAAGAPPARDQGRARLGRHTARKEALVMRQEVFVGFGRGREVEIALPAGSPMAADEARRWLDEQFVAHECEPLRASGKVLTVDKVLVLAGAIGPERLQRDEAYRTAFGRAVATALGNRALVRIDVEAGAVTF